MIWILGGTSEARKIVSRIQDLDNYIVTVATEEGKEFIHDSKIRVGRLDYFSMENLIKEENIKLIVDLTHPYAKVVSENAKKIGENFNIPYIRYVRSRTEISDGVVYAEDYEEAYKILSNIRGTVFFTTGSKNIKDFEKVRGDNRFIYRILPAIDSIKIASDNKVKMKDIIAILGPFTKEFNKSMFENYKVDYCVTKDSGVSGGTEEKIEAARESGVKIILIGRTNEKGYKDLGDIERKIREVKANDRRIL